MYSLAFYNFEMIILLGLLDEVFKMECKMLLETFNGDGGNHDKWLTMLPCILCGPC